MSRIPSIISAPPSLDAPGRPTGARYAALTGAPRAGSTRPRMGPQHIVSVEQFEAPFLDRVFSVTEEMARTVATRGRLGLCDDCVVALLFYEPSSRTMLSFQSAAQRLRAGLIFAQGRDDSSMKKGESIEDTIRVVSTYSDLIVMRHWEPGAAKRAASAASVPFINGGDGGNEHPTQALIDAFTIRKELGRLEDLHIIFGFDPRHSRSIHSLALLLSKTGHNRMTFVSPEELRMPGWLRTQLLERGMTIEETSSLDGAGEADVLYVNRLQQERFDAPSDFERLRRELVVTPALLEGSDAIVLNPLPRIDEIELAVDDLPNAKYFEQVAHGVPLRMALLSMLLGRR
jgi:aspartate carbamoyltransferase catalytic subunit